MKRKKVHVVRVINGFRLDALCGTWDADYFESDNIRKVTCKRCRRMARDILKKR